MLDTTSVLWRTICHPWQIVHSYGNGSHRSSGLWTSAIIRWRTGHVTFEEMRWKNRRDLTAWSYLGYSSSRSKLRAVSLRRDQFCGWIYWWDSHILVSDDHSGDLSLYAEREYDINAGIKWWRCILYISWSREEIPSLNNTWKFVVTKLPIWRDDWGDTSKVMAFQQQEKVIEDFRLIRT